jgi:hypothetical protein
MDRYLVLQSDNAQVTTFQFRYRRPKAMAILLLWLGSNRTVEYLNTPLFLQIRTFSQNFLLEIISKSILCHMPRISQSRHNVTGSLDISKLLDAGAFRDTMPICTQPTSRPPQPITDSSSVRFGLEDIVTA